MRDSLLKWIGDADAIHYMNRFGVREIPLDFGYLQSRKDDLYIALVGELFDCMRDNDAQPDDWTLLGNSLAQFTAKDRAEELQSVGISQNEATLYSAAAFYFGGFPASAHVMMRSLSIPSDNEDSRACFDILARPKDVVSPLIRDLLAALKSGDLVAIATIEATVSKLAKAALQVGPEAWIPLRLLESLLAKFRMTNLRAILPEGGSPFWSPLVTSLVKRGTWDFFPSQIKAIQRGLLDSTETFSLLMPTGAGKTALCETLLFYHLKTNPDSAAVLLVPYRSLASELRSTLVKRLNSMGISARCAYGGTVPTGDEVHAFDATRALIATPETLSGILSANRAFAERISLVICDEGHLLDTPSRGVGLELLLTRMKNFQLGSQRFVFLSAIIPNIDEINAWLGGTADSVVRSDYRPAIAEFSVLRPVCQKASASWDLEMHAHEAEPIRYRIKRFLWREDFQWLNPITNRMNTYRATLKTLAIASARKALTMGTVVVFAANKRGNVGAIGLADELLKQMEKPLQLPKPISFAKQGALDQVAEYLVGEYGADWVGTLVLRAGAVLHHGDIPQETREVVERLLRDGSVKFGICTSTLSEGVNFPIRTLVLYSVQRVRSEGARENLLTRDIKNLVGRAGRAGATTKGLVICTNEDQWPLVAVVAQQASGEPVIGALRKLIENVCNQLVIQNITLTNELLEQSPDVHTLIDGIDATLVDLAATEIGEDELHRLANNLAEQTFSVRQTDEASKQFLRNVFSLRAQRVAAIRAGGRIEWIRETGARTRMMDPVETGLLPLRPTWDDVVDPLDPSLVDPILSWAWNQSELQKEVRKAYRLGNDGDIDSRRESFFSAVRLWLSGANFTQIAEGANLTVDDMLGIHSQVLTFAMQTIVEQALALLEKLLLSRNQMLAQAVLQFPEHLRFGVPTAAGRILAASGIRHRRAFVALGNDSIFGRLQLDDKNRVRAIAKQRIETDREYWLEQLGSLVLKNTIYDLSLVTGNN